MFALREGSSHANRHYKPLETKPLESPEASEFCRRRQNFGGRSPKKNSEARMQVRASRREESRSQNSESRILVRASRREESRSQKPEARIQNTGARFARLIRIS